MTHSSPEGPLGSAVTADDQPTGLPRTVPPAAPPPWPPAYPEEGAWSYAAPEPPVEPPIWAPQDDPPLQYVEHPATPPRAVEWPEFPTPEPPPPEMTGRFGVLHPTTEQFTAVHPPARHGWPPAAEAELVDGEIVWHQPAPTAPFHAKHEKPGEWHTHPPDHLAYEHSRPAEVQPGVQRDLPTEAIPLSMLPQPWQVPFDPHHAEAQPRTERPGGGNRWVALAVVLTVLLLTAGTVSAYVMLRDADSGKGAPDPATAVDRFLTAVYTQHNPATAGGLVCSEARDTAGLRSRVEQVKAYATDYQAPQFRWAEPAVSTATKDTARVDVQLIMSTDDEKSVEQNLVFTVVRKTGWLVCDVNG